MDPFGAEGELVNIHTAFIQGQYTSVLNDFDASSFSESNALPIRILQYRAQCALGQHQEVISAISDSDAKSAPDLAAAKLYASYLHSPSDSLVSSAETLAEQASDNLHVQVLIGTVLARAGKPDQALALLANHQGSLDAVALIIQIHLSQTRVDLALKEARSARSFAQDALLVNLAESWIGLRQGGENYQKAFYVFEELAQGPSSASATSLIAQAVSELHMGRVEEAETALGQASALEPEHVEGIANDLVLKTIVGKETGDLVAKLQTVEKEHELLRELAVKREQFQAAMGKYNPKFEP
ncbi:Coatomer subunit epsilon-1 [Fulvia fulva]|uniref:Coatomer subunit epsilon n=1 Tax=Passalora fulva TaxID=5499 RepID=A0A9Q8P2Z7_PASFU|nr:Coatomer subunit epsilon-1 [Fulvia fulva]KAK4636019.1 Coatomer subunit epsilon-1 [Fulvia fulva]KAK4638616.1 Coatomer subunit epsilon-1 [Fulvia fulva]UJO11279.1 Coatomer subunit epsilon-1 [Fulvia fulva]WPV09030.1 Coatomer subunit epsilon-1 [Fulvia fulva]WPV24152.1 Coatomer subunit epsilon-1 [Fulvia fulva]